MTPEDPRHGTEAGHSQHRRDGEEPCSACRKARSAATYDRTFGEDDVPLTGGQWVNVRGIMRWQPDPLPPLPDDQPQRRHSKPGEAICGTDAGYYRHRRKHKEPACEACKEAHREAERARHRKEVAA